MRHSCGMTTAVNVDACRRIARPRDVQRATGIPWGQTFKESATPGRIVMEVEANPGRILKRGKLKTWNESCFNPHNAVNALKCDTMKRIYRIKKQIGIRNKALPVGDCLWIGNSSCSSSKSCLSVWLPRSFN